MLKEQAHETNMLVNCLEMEEINAKEQFVVITFNASQVKKRDVEYEKLSAACEIKETTKESLDEFSAILELDLYHTRRLPDLLLSTNYVNQFTLHVAAGYKDDYIFFATCLVRADYYKEVFLLLITV